MIERKTLRCREEWLEARKKSLGGSDIGTAMGLNPYKDNVTLWREFTGRETPEDVTDNPAVRFGSAAEPHIREIFRLRHPELDVSYVPDNIWTNTDVPFAHASLDGWLTDGVGNLGILEVKTALIHSGQQRNDWRDRIPQSYYCQILWYMMVTGAQYGWITALLRDERTEGQVAQIVDYFICRKEDEIEYIREQGERFWRYVQEDQEPPRILPEI